MPASVGDLVATTLRDRSGEFADNVSEHTALLTRLKKRGNMRTSSGGRSIFREVSYPGNSTYARYSGYDLLNSAASEALDAAEFGWKQAAITVAMSGLEEIINNGAAAVFDLLEERINNAKAQMANNMSTDLYSDGTADSGRQITGVRAHIQDAGQGTVGGIDSAIYPWWRNAIFDFSDNGLTAGVGTITTAMNSLWLATKRNTDQADLIVADNNYYTFYWNSLQAIQRINSVARGEAGYTEIGYMGADVVPDGGLSGDAPANRMYFFNTKYFQLVTHEKRQWVPLDARYSTNQDAMVQYVVWAGNLVCSNRSLQGVILP